MIGRLENQSEKAKRFSRLDRSLIGSWWWTVDRTLLSIFLILATLGVVMVTSASPPVAEHLKLGHFYFLKRHIIILIPALMMMIGISMLDRRQIWRLGTLLFGGSILALILVLFTGAEIKGAQRWIRVLGFSLQPSEFIKPAFVIVAAWMMALQKNMAEGQGKARKFNGTWVSAFLYLIVITLLLLQPDLGMTVVVTTVFATQIFLAGLPFRYLIVFAGLGVSGMLLAYSTLGHVQSRIDRFLNPESGDNYQVEKSLEAFQNGGLMGTGPGQGTVKLRLPDGHADFIFSVAAEEMGLIFALLIMLLFGYVVYRGLNRLMEHNDMFSVLAVGGLLTMFGLQAFIHMGSALRLLPAKGMTLPFMSYGGSSLLAICIAMGVVLSLTRRQKRTGISKAGLSLSQDKTNTEYI